MRKSSSSAALFVVLIVLFSVMEHVFHALVKLVFAVFKLRFVVNQVLLVFCAAVVVQNVNVMGVLL